MPFMKSRHHSFYRRSLTIMEILVVIVIIGLVSSVIAYNVRGALRKGKDFKTEQAMNMLEDLITLEVKSSQIQNLVSKPNETLEKTGLVKNIDKLMTDGWGSRFEIKDEGGSKVRIHSPNLPSKKDRIVNLSGS